MFKLPDLPYAYDALGKYISKDIMELHHYKHHQAYVDKLNAALEGKGDVGNVSVETLISELGSLPKDIRTAVRNNGGGHYNHTLFWQWMNPDGGGEPNGELSEAITQTFGSFQGFVDEFTQKALGVFGSGWAWLMPDMTILTTPNQDSPLMDGKAEPILGLDVWEHAYYLDYKNKRDDYIKAWWNVVDWGYVEKRFNK